MKPFLLVSHCDDGVWQDSSHSIQKTDWCHYETSPLFFICLGNVERSQSTGSWQTLFQFPRRARKKTLVITDKLTSVPGKITGYSEIMREVLFNKLSFFFSQGYPGEASWCDLLGFQQSWMILWETVSKALLGGGGCSFWGPPSQKKVFALRASSL